MLLTKNLEILGRMEAEDRLLCSPPVSHMISIRDVRAAGVKNDHHVTCSRLSMAFDDVSVPREGYHVVDQEQIHTIIQFGRLMVRELDTVTTFLCHCEAGVSRSAAAMYVVLCDALGPGRESEAGAKIRAIRSFSHPNRRMLDLAAKELYATDKAAADFFRHAYKISPQTYWGV